MYFVIYINRIRLTTLIIFWQNTLPANIRKWVFSWNKRDGIAWRNYKFAWNSCTVFWREWILLFNFQLLYWSSLDAILLYEYVIERCNFSPGTMQRVWSITDLSCQSQNLDKWPWRRVQSTWWHLVYLLESNPSILKSNWLSFCEIQWPGNSELLLRSMLRHIKN